MVGGETVKVEDKRIVYLPFNQLFTGYGWGVKHVPITGRDANTFPGITVLAEDRTIESVEKFEAVNCITEVKNNKEYTVSEFFKAKDNIDVAIKLKNDSHVRVTISKKLVYEDDKLVYSSAGGSFTPSSNWGDGVISFNGTGTVYVFIQDYFYRVPTVIELNVVSGDTNMDAGEDDGWFGD